MKYTIESSRDYSRFISNEEQRLHLEGHIQNLRASLRLWNFIPSHPVAVVKQGSKYLIIDGHSIFDAAKQEKAEFFFIVLPDKFRDAVAILNLQKSWTAGDHARRYAIRGDEDYVTLLAYVSKGIPLKTAASMLYGQAAGSGNACRKLADGTFKVRDTEQADIIADFIEDLSEECPAVKSRNFIEALSMCYYVDEFDAKRFKAKISANPRAITKTTTRDEMLSLIDEVYNFKASIKIPLAFRAKEVAKARQKADPHACAAASKAA